MLLAFGFCERRNVGVVVDGALVQALLGVLVTHACLALFNELLALFTMWGSFGTQRRQLIILIIRLCAKLLFSSALGYFYAGLIADAPFAEQHVELATWMDDVLLEHTAFCAVAAAYAGPAALSALGQALPCISTWVRTWRPPFAALVDLFEPTNALFVGKKARSRPIEIPPPPASRPHHDVGYSLQVHTAGCARKLQYDFFWLSMLIVKFWFSYAFQVIIRPPLHRMINAPL